MVYLFTTSIEIQSFGKIQMISYQKDSWKKPHWGKNSKWLANRLLNYFSYKNIIGIKKFIKIFQIQKTTSLCIRAIFSWSSKLHWTKICPNGGENSFIQGNLIYVIFYILFDINQVCISPNDWKYLFLFI